VDSGHQVEDEELSWLLSRYANVWLTAAAGADLLLSKLDGGGGITSKRVGDMAISYDRSYYTGMRERWQRLGLTHQAPFCGGISTADSALLPSETDWPRPAFTKGLHDDRRLSGGGDDDGA
jgi:hypothetical protein